MKITENYIEISSEEIRQFIMLAMIGAGNVYVTKEVRDDTISYLKLIDDKCQVKHGELFEIRVVGDK